ncbi:MAG: hypothetical protein U5R06_07320 [candidate division KSB1 bacterium]|nr:hypothetical protein [candidate division KSB1 bacterium]
MAARYALVWVPEMQAYWYTLFLIINIGYCEQKRSIIIPVVMPG